MTARASLNQLNDDILSRIFDYLDYDDKIRLQRTCTKWRRLISSQLRRVKALRLGQFHAGGYQITSGLSMFCCEHHQAGRRSSHRRETGTLFSEHLFQLPADLETQCFSVSRYDFLHRALKQSHQSITMLSLGRVHISYRLLVVLANNLANLEHLELIDCASRFEESGSRTTTSNRRLAPAAQETCEQRPTDNASNGPTNDNDNHLPSLESFNGSESQRTMSKLKSSILTNIMYNQHPDEQVNVRERLIRSTFVRNCNLIREAKREKQWARMKHLLVKECNLMNEFTLSLILSLTSQTLVHLEIEKNQYLTGEFLNYCGPQLEVLRIKHCPSMRQSFVDDLVKIRKLLGSSIKFGTCHDQESSSSSLKLTTSGSSAALFAILFSA